MTDASLGSLVLRMVVSLGVVFACIGVGYLILRRRQAGGAAIRSRRTSVHRPKVTVTGRPSRAITPTRSANQRKGVRVVGRVGVGRATQLVAVQFADRVYLVAASDAAAPNVIAQVHIDEWLEATDEVETVIPVTPELVAIEGGAERPAPRGFVDALREATVRRV